MRFPHPKDEQHPEYLSAPLATPAPYIGVLGPRGRTQRLLARLSGDLSRAYGTVGFDLGADGAEQVALSVLAEILAVHAGTSGRPLRNRPRSIHGRDEE